jgi:hypothetical protein
VALKVQNLLARDVSQFGAFDGAQSVLTRPHAIESVETRRIPGMDPCPFIPVSAIDFDWVGHDEFTICSADLQHPPYEAQLFRSGPSVSRTRRIL